MPPTVCISFRKGTDGKEQLALQSQSSTAVYGPNNFYWDSETQTSHNKSTNTVTVKESWFESSTPPCPTRNCRRQHQYARPAPADR